MKRFSLEEVDFIQKRACERITEILDAIGCSYTERHDYLQAACPVHDGDNQRAMFWAIQSNHWQCKTRNCHLNQITGHSTSIFGLVRGTMTRKTKQQWTFQQTVNFVAQILGLGQINLNDINAQDMEIAKIVKEYRKNRNKNTPIKGVPLSDMISLLKPDKVYYPNRGVSEEIIARYHISFCNTKGKSMYKRAFFPILDETGKYIIGWSGRSIYDKCSKCKIYHDSKRFSCPAKEYRGIYTKWRHSNGFKREHSLYNIWYAKPFINKTGIAILCEGSGDVWAYEEAGIRNSIALLGLSVSKQQRLILQNAGALTIICAFDNDSAGINAAKIIEKELTHYFRIFILTPETANDIGDMLPKEIKSKINPILEKIGHYNLENNHEISV